MSRDTCERCPATSQVKRVTGIEPAWPAWKAGRCRAVCAGQRLVVLSERVRVTTEVFSTDWSFGAGQDERCFGDGADPLRAQSDAVERLPAGLEQRDPAFTFGA